MIKKSKDYIELRNFLDDGKIIPLKLTTLYGDIEHCYGKRTNYKTLTNDYKIGNKTIPVSLNSEKFNAFCILYDIEFEEPLKIE